MSWRSQADDAYERGGIDAVADLFEGLGDLVINDQDEYDRLRRRRLRLWTQLQAQGGRGVGLADEIDELDRALDAYAGEAS